MRDQEWKIDDRELFVMQELWALVEQARQAGRWPFDDPTGS